MAVEINMYTLEQTHELMQLHEELHSINTKLHQLEMYGVVFIISDKVEYDAKVKELKLEFLSTVSKINTAWKNIK